MIQLSELKQQHQEIAELIQVLSILLHDKSVRHTKTVFKLFEQLFEKLNNHLELEGKTLYPELLVHKNQMMQEVAMRFLSGSDAITKFFAKYMKNCQTWQATTEKDDTFVHETDKIFDFLKKRVRAEEEEFFPLISQNH
jgi:DNA gyrase/topoisomerase IV subunit B